MFVWLLLIIVAYFLYKWSTANYDYFVKKGIPFNKPLPLVGSRLGLIIKKRNVIEFADYIYNEFPNEKVTGMFEFRQPSYFIRDPELIKRLTIKEFDNFPDRRMVFSEDSEPLLTKALSLLRGQEWKDMRSTLSPAFTGSKMRLMFELMNTVGAQTAKTVRDQIINGATNNVDFKEFSRRFTVDIIATCSFGIEVNSFENPNNEFVYHAKQASDFNSFKTSLKIAGFLLSPTLMRWLNIPFINAESTKFFRDAIYSTMKIRDEKNIVRHDLIDLLSQVRKGYETQETVEDVSTDGFATVEESDIGKSKVKRKWNDTELLAQCFVFFFAGFETVSTVMTFMAYELLANPDIQKRLQNEIDEVQKSLNGGKLTYEHIQKMKYMDQVVSETLRKWPPAPIMDRMCVKDFTLEYDDKKFVIEKGYNFYIPIYSFQRDPKYFPNPDTFDPDRFSDENKGNINPDTYLPFGIGPRNCIGSRFALLEVKANFYYILLNFNMEPNKETTIPLKLVNSQVVLQIENSLRLSLVPRTK